MLIRTVNRAPLSVSASHPLSNVQWLPVRKRIDFKMYGPFISKLWTGALSVCFYVDRIVCSRDVLLITLY